MKPLSKKERKLKLENQKKKKARKDNTILFVGILVFVFALFQIAMITYYYVNSNGHNQIVLNHRVVTTEVCKQWFNYTTEYQQALTKFEFYDGFLTHLVPKDIVIEVCDKWKAAKEEIDKENELSLCEQYSELNKIEMKYINGSKYVLLNNQLILEDEVKKSCFN
jgi:flagellar basal body-associated protein FliL